MSSGSAARQSPQIAFIQSCWHRDIVDQSRDSFLKHIKTLGYARKQVDCYEVPGAFEIPLHAKLLAESGRYVTVLSLVAIPVYVADIGLNVAGSRELALRNPGDRRALIGNILGQRMAIMPVGVLLIIAFALLAGYPTRMVVGTALAGSGVFIVALANALLLPLTVELRNAGRQAARSAF